MSEKKEDFFWVIFDTCTRPQYYQDVHNILALPDGCIYRYDYRTSQMSQSAIKAASSNSIGRALLIYAQADNYHKREISPSRDFPVQRIIWAATRLAEVVLIPPQEGETFYFDLKLTNYPKSDQSILNEILQPLIRLEEVPFKKWVTTSQDINKLNTLSSGDDDNNWESIVSTLSNPPSQFEGDYFWRLRAPINSDKGIKLRIKYQEIPLKGTTEIRKINSYYEAEEGIKSAVELISYIPQYFPETSQQNVQVSVNEKSPIYIVGKDKYDLRPHSAEIINFATSRSDPLTASTGVILIESKQDNNQFPLGPKINIEFKVFKPIWKIVIAILCILLSSYLGFLALIWQDQNPNITIAAGVAGFIFLGIASLLLFARLKTAEI